jgi:hypothetical protein
MIARRRGRNHVKRIRDRATEETLKRKRYAELRKKKL